MSLDLSLCRKCDLILNQVFARGLAPCLAIKCGWTCTDYNNAAVKIKYENVTY